MVMFNLLPWREQRARYEKYQMLKIIIGVMVGALFFLIIMDAWLCYQRDGVLERIGYLKKEAAWRKGLTKASPVMLAAPVNENWYDFFARLNESHQKEICFEQVKKTKENIELIGITPSAEELTAFLRTSELISYFSEVKVQQLQPQETNQLRFHLVGKLHAL